MYLCSYTEHELPLNAEYPVCVSLDSLKVHKQEFSAHLVKKITIFLSDGINENKKSNRKGIQTAI